jgi:hypothetical protein
MRKPLGIILTVLLGLGILLAINAAAYVQEEEQDDSELAPNRSTYNSRATGTRALYDLLSESGYKAMRWREAPDRLLAAGGDKVRTFVIVGRPRVAITKEEAKALMLWVERGGRLVIIDRRPEEDLLPPSGDWRVTTEFLEYPNFSVDPADPAEMTKDVKAVTPVQPTRLTRDVESVMPSRFFSAIKIFATNNTGDASKAERDNSGNENANGHESSPGHSAESESTESSLSAPISPAPVVHLGTPSAGLLVDYPHGEGNIILLADPFIVANVGIGLKDNLQLTLNLLASSGGLIAFDEFHQGRGATHNAFASYFAGTPVLAIFAQVGLIIILVLWTRGRRFARPLPLREVDRRSSLEFVASMAELQQRAKAFDLAIENIYSRTRRVLARYAGVDYNSPRAEIAARVAARSTLDAHQLETLMRQSEDAINGGAISERQSIQLVSRLREVENTLGLRMRSREVRQTAQNI